MSCLVGSSRHASVVVFLTQVTKPTQHIGAHTGDRYQIPPYLSLESTSFWLVCLAGIKTGLAQPAKVKIQSWGRSISLGNFSPDAWQEVRIFSYPQTWTLRILCTTVFFLYSFQTLQIWKDEWFYLIWTLEIKMLCWFRHLGEKNNNTCMSRWAC